MDDRHAEESGQKNREGCGWAIQVPAKPSQNGGIPRLFSDLDTVGSRIGTLAPPRDERGYMSDTGLEPVTPSAPGSGKTWPAN